MTDILTRYLAHVDGLRALAAEVDAEADLLEDDPDPTRYKALVKLAAYIGSTPNPKAIVRARHWAAEVEAAPLPTGVYVFHPDDEAPTPERDYVTLSEPLKGATE